jgi:hypothetical protein
LNLKNTFVFNEGKPKKSKFFNENSDSDEDDGIGMSSRGSNKGTTQDPRTSQTHQVRISNFLSILYFKKQELDPQWDPSYRFEPQNTSKRGAEGSQLLNKRFFFIQNCTNNFYF